MIINKILSSIFINTLVIYIISKYIPQLGFIIHYKVCSLEIFLLLGGIFWFLDVIVKKIVKILTIPLNILTLGLFGIIINILFIYLFQYIVNTYLGLYVIVELGTIIQVVIVSILIWILNLALKKL